MEAVKNSLYDELITYRDKLVYIFIKSVGIDSKEDLADMSFKNLMCVNYNIGLLRISSELKSDFVRDIYSLIDQIDLDLSIYIEGYSKK